MNYDPVPNFREANYNSAQYWRVSIEDWAEFVAYWRARARAHAATCDRAAYVMACDQVNYALRRVYGGVTSWRIDHSSKYAAQCIFEPDLVSPKFEGIAL